MRDIRGNQGNRCQLELAALKPKPYWPVLGIVGRYIKDLRLDVRRFPLWPKKRGAKMKQDKMNEMPKYDAYRDGFIDALMAYGIWNDGVQRIGCLGKPIKDIIKYLESNSMFQPPTEETQAPDTLKQRDRLLKACKMVLNLDFSTANPLTHKDSPVNELQRTRYRYYQQIVISAIQAAIAECGKENIKFRRK